MPAPQNQQPMWGDAILLMLVIGAFIAAEVIARMPDGWIKP